MAAQLLAAYRAFFVRFILLLPPVLNARLAEGVTAVRKHDFFLGVETDAALRLEFLIEACGIARPRHFSYFIFALFVALSRDLLFGFLLFV